MKHNCEYCGVKIRHYDEGECLDCSQLRRWIEKNPAAAINILANISEKNNKKIQTGELTFCPNCSIGRIKGYNFCYQCGRNYAHR